jgi:hypothetical protein
MNDIFDNDVATVIYDNPCYFYKSYDNPLFIPTIDMHDKEEVCFENLYDNALDDGPILLDVINYNATENRIAIMRPIPFKSDQSSCFANSKSEKEEVFIFNFDPTILELVVVVKQHMPWDGLDGAELSAGRFRRGKRTEEHDRKEHRSTQVRGSRKEITPLLLLYWWY